MTANGTQIAQGRLERTVPEQFSIVDVSMDSGSAVDFTYQLPFKFNGKIDKVTIELRPEPAATSKATRSKTSVKDATSTAKTAEPAPT